MSLPPNDFDALRKIASDPNKVSIILQTQRLGTQLFCVMLEYQNYPPRTKKNKLLDFSIVKWPDDFPLLWFVVSIPKKDFHLAEEAAKNCGLIIKPGSPVMLGGKEDQIFPIEGDNVYSVESSKDSLIYKNDTDQIERMKKAEKLECDRIIHADEKKIKVELIEKGYSEPQIDRILAQWNAGNIDYTEQPDEK